MKIPTVSKMREQIGELLASTRYTPKKDAKTDRHGMPILAPEPDDPDDEVAGGAK